MGNSSSTEAAYETLYRPPDDGEDTAHKHPVQKVTRRQIYIDRTAEDGTLAGPAESAGEVCHVSRGELEANGSVLDGPTSTRFYKDPEAAEANV